MTDADKIKAGDTIRHVPSREKWTVAARQGEYIICCGWPETMAPITDCDLIRSCTEEEEVKQLRETANIRGQTRGAWARATLEAKGLA